MDMDVNIGTGWSKSPSMVLVYKNINFNWYAITDKTFFLSCYYERGLLSHSLDQLTKIVQTIPSDAP